jgi:hypothetical protein
MQSVTRFPSWLDRLAGSMGLAGARLEPDAICARALRDAGRSRFSDTSFMGPLAHLLACARNEADLNVLGRYAFEWDALRSLSNRLRFEAEEEKDGTILEEPIEKPIFITGFPRSGTTLLHTLLMEDAAILAPRCFETISPYPNGRRDRRRARVGRMLRFFQLLAPEMRSMHPLSAGSPQECTEITAQAFQSLRYEMTHRVPSYQTWLDGHGHIAAYRFHKRFLQHLQHRGGAGRWILKSPDHVHAFDAIEAVYPDCGIVFVHRDPMRVAASAMKLTEVVRRPFARRIDRTEIGRQVLARLAQAAHAAINRAAGLRGRNVFHLHYASFAADPLGTVAALYRHFEMELTQAARERMAAFLATAPRTGNSYHLEDYGIDPSDLSDQFAFYMDHFDVQSETALWNTSRTARAPVAA